MFRNGQQKCYIHRQLSIIVIQIQGIMINPAQFECPVCLTPGQLDQAYSIGSCKHLFCQSCCMQHIDARLAMFQAVRCLDTSCSQKLTPSSKIYNNLSFETKRKVAKYEQFVLLQGNQKLKPCQNAQCLGVINQNKPINDVNGKATLECEICRMRHCSQCLTIHNSNENCKQMDEKEKKKEEDLMKALNYRKCPNCSVWVQKNGGCQYLKCKCKTEFCFNCGSRFQNDPCRKINIQQSEKEVRNLLRLSQNFSRPQKGLDYLCFLPKTILKLLLVTLLTSLGGLLFMGIIFGLLIPVIYLTAPAGFIVLAGESSLQPSQICLLRILIVLFYPLIGFVVAVATFVVFTTYPFMRILYDSQLYDEMDRFMHQMSAVYLRGIVCILSI